MAGDLLQRGNAKAVVFIDTGIADWQTLINAAPEGADFVTLDPTRDGLAQMAQWAQTHSGYDAIHIVSHGSKGQIHLGNFTLDASAINTRASDLAQLGAALNEKGDLLLYGCSVASGEGQDFIAALAQATQADVAASDDLTGSAALGGDWDMEAASGDIETAVIFADNAMQSFAGVLAATSDNFDAYGANISPGATSLSLGDWTFGAGVAMGMANASSTEATIHLNVDDGAGDRAVFMNYESIQGFTTFYFKSTDGTDFDLNSFDIGNNFSLAGTNVTIVGYKGGVEVVGTSELVNLTASDSIGAITYSTSDGSSDDGYFGTVTFGSAYDLVDEVRFIFDENGSLSIDNLNVSPVAAPANNAPTITGAPSDLTVTEDTISNVDLSGVTLADSDGDNLTVTLTASAGTLAASSSGSVTVSGSGTGALTLAGTAANINTYLDTTTNIQYTGASNASGDNAATLTIKANDGTVDSSTTTVNVDITAVDNASTFGFETGVMGLGTKTVTAVGADTTFTIESESAELLDSDNGGFTDANLSGSESIDTGYDPAETKLTFSIEPGKQFDLSSLMLQSWDGDNEVFVLTSVKGSIEFIVLDTTPATITTLDIANHINADFFKGITSFTLTENTVEGVSSGFYITFDDLVVTNITAVPANAAPTITGAPSDITVTEDTASNVDLSGVTFADSDGDNLTVTLAASAGTLAASSSGIVTVSGSGTGALTLAGTAANINTYLDTTSNIQYTGASNASGDNAANLTIKANDGTVDSSTTTVNVDITAVNDAPVFTSSNKANVAENTTAVTTLAATDADGDTLTYSISGGADQALFSLDSNSGALTFINAPDFEAPGDSNSDNAYAVEVTANDGQSTTPLTLTITVTDVNEAPTLTGTTKADVPENSTGPIYTATASDPENNPLTYALSGTDAALFDLNANSGALSFKTAPDFEAPGDAGGNNVYDVILTANDGSLNSNPQALTITVTDVNDTNDAPVFTSSNKASVAENTTAVTTLVATDADADMLTYSISGGADKALFSLDSNSGALTFINAPDFEAPGDSNSDNAYDVEVTANDGQSTTPLTLTITVTDVNEAPTLTGTTKADVPENSTGTIYTATASDPENNPLTYALSGTDAALFDLNANSGALSFKTAPDFEAPGDAGGNNVYDVILTANDGSLNSTPQALAITVTDVNETQPTPTPTPTPTPEPTPTPPPIQVTPPEAQPNTPSGRPSVKETITNTGSDQAATKLVENSGNANEVTATLPGGVSLVNQGARTAVDPFQALGDLVNSIDAQQPTNLNGQTSVASQWLTNRPPGTLLDIRTLVISESGSSSFTTPVQITGIGNANSSHQEAFVIDVRLLPPGNRLQLDNIDFASIIGETMITGGAGANVVVADDAAQMIVLGEDDDELHAGGGRDLVGSKGGDDLIFGEAGYDRLFGGEGNDVLNGGSGVDVARFTIDAASAELRYADDGSLMVSAGELGTDTLISVELLRFNDQVVLVDAPAPQSVLGFDEKSYLAMNSDVAMAVAQGDFESGIAHYAQHGRQEGRRGELNGFDEAFYLAQNPDVAAAVSRGEFVSGFHHYMRWGDGEGRDPNALFDEVWYRAQNSDVNRAIELGVFDNAYEHYLAFGNAEQRLPSAWFDTADYLANNQDVAEAQFNPVLHYLSYGVNEGRVIVADDAGLWG